MNIIPVEVIKKKRDGLELSADEITDFVNGFTRGEITEYQTASLLMSIFWRGLNDSEASVLTRSMLESGEVLSYPEIPSLKVDKHSTGGVGDKTSLILAPIVAAAGLTVPMISGRGLGHSGGTLDKLESIPGFTTQLSLSDFRKMLAEVGVSLIGQTAEICPADKKLYALRDVTGTVESIPLICASIMSKKLAEGIDGLVLDVKHGSGAFMKTLEDAQKLAQSLIAIGKNHGKKVTALITSMEQPLGRFIGNSLEVEECVAIMKNEDVRGVALAQFEDTIELSLALAGEMIFLGGAADSYEDGTEKARQILASGKAYEKFAEICKWQNGDLDNIPQAQHKYVVHAQQEGFIQGLQTEEIGMSSLMLGAGRMQTTDQIDPTAGIEIHEKIGDKVSIGDPLFTLYSSTFRDFESCEERLLGAVEFSLQKVESPSLIKERLV